MKTATLMLLAVGTVASNATENLLLSSGYVFNTTEVRYTFEDDGGNNITTALQTDATGNGRILTGINNGGAFLGAPLAPGSTYSIGITNHSYGYSMANTALMPTDNYQISIYVTPGKTYDNVDRGPMTIFSADGLRLGINSSYQYYAEVNETTIGAQTTSDWDGKGLMIQKKQGEVSFWIANASTNAWAQVGSTSLAVAGNNFAGTHLFVKPGGGETFFGYVDTFQIQSFTAVPEPTSALAGLLITAGLLRRRRA